MKLGELVAKDWVNVFTGFVRKGGVRRGRWCNLMCVNVCRWLSLRSLSWFLSMVISRMASMVFALLGVDSILGNGCRVWRQNYLI